MCYNANSAWALLTYFARLLRSWFPFKQNLQGRIWLFDLLSATQITGDSFDSLPFSFTNIAELLQWSNKWYQFEPDNCEVFWNSKRHSFQWKSPIEITAIISDWKYQTFWPWRWSSGQGPRLLLRWSEFESCWLLNLYEKTKRKEKEAGVGPS